MRPWSAGWNGRRCRCIGSRRCSAAWWSGCSCTASWTASCPPCRKEAPDLAAASRDTAKTARFVGLNIRDDREAAQAFTRAFKTPYPSIFDPEGKQLVKFSGQLSTTAIPTTLVIDRAGRSAARITGPVDRDTLAALITDTANGK